MKPSRSQWIIRLVAIAIIAALIYAVVRFPAISNSGATIATALLLYVTLEYVLANHQNVKLFREQLEHQRRVSLDFGVKAENMQALVWVANLGLANFIVRRVIVRAHHTNTDKQTYVPTELVIPSGKVGTLPIPRGVYEAEELFLDVDISIQYAGLEQPGQTEHRAFSLMVNNRVVIDVKEGLHSPWSVGCPKCGKWMGINMQTEGLRNFDEAHKREKLLEADLTQTCPNHQSRWILTMEDVERDRKPT